MLIEQGRNLIVFVLMLGGLIFIHELAHFLTAIYLKIDVEEFGIGLPPRMIKLGTWRGTALTLNWVPIGGFVRLKGEDKGAGERSFATSPARTRIAILLAGSLANLVLGYLVFMIGFATGWPDQVQIVEVMRGSPAESGGLQAGDRVLAANGVAVHHTGELIAVFNSHVDQQVTLLVQRDGENVMLYITPNPRWSSEGYLTGIRMHSDVVRYSLPRAAQRAGEQVLAQLNVTLRLPAQMSKPQSDPNAVRLISPVGLKQVSDKVVENSVEKNALYPLLNLIAVISTALGIANLLPIPALDGGRIVFVLIEVLRRKRIDPMLERWAHVGGMVAIYALTLVLVIYDVIHPIF